MTCPKNYEGEYIARELAQKQSLDNLNSFGDRLQEMYFKYIKKEDSDER